jgi:bifunctional non-homologous end joining protein LigD
MKMRTDPVPSFIPPMLANSRKQPFNDTGWIFEVKLDGFRMIADIKKNSLRIYSRNNVTWNDRFGEIAGILKKKIKQPCVLDGELVVLNEKGVPSFEMIHEYFQKKEGTPVYYVFDVLFLNGRDLRPLELGERKKILKKLIKKSNNIRPCEYVEGNGVAFFNILKKNGFEGVVAKNKKSRYESGERSGAWIKIKAFLSQEAVICGFTAPGGSRKRFGALILGVKTKKGLRHIGQAGSGFSEEMLELVYKKLRPLITKKSPFAEPVLTNTPAVWVKPKLVAEIKFSEWTKDGIMRQPTFQGLREDKSAEEVVRE